MSHDAEPVTTTKRRCLISGYYSALLFHINQQAIRIDGLVKDLLKLLLFVIDHHLREYPIGHKKLGDKGILRSA
jgi:hypothetical protein